MNEAGFIRAIHRRLPKEIHAWKVNASFARGVPDCWYSGHKGDLWVEYKFVATPPKRVITPRLSALQEEWIKQRRSEGRNVAVVVGWPDGAVIGHRPTSTFSMPASSSVSWNDVAGFITRNVHQ